MPRLPNGLKVVGKKKRNAKPSTLARKLRRQQKANLNIDPEAKKARRREFRKAKARGTEDEFYRKYSKPFGARGGSGGDAGAGSSAKTNKPNNNNNNNNNNGDDGDGSNSSVQAVAGRGSGTVVPAADSEDGPPPAKRKMSKKMKRKLKAQQSHKEETYFSIAQTVETEDGEVVSVDVDAEAFADTSHAATGVDGDDDFDDDEHDEGSYTDSGSDKEDSDSEDDDALEKGYDVASRPADWAASDEQTRKLPTRSASTGRIIPGQIVSKESSALALDEDTENAASNSKGATQKQGGGGATSGAEGNTEVEDDDADESVGDGDSGDTDDSDDDDDDDDDDDEEEEEDSEDEEVRAIMANRQRVQLQTQAKSDIAHYSQYILANPGKGVRPPRGARSHMQELHRYSKSTDPSVICWALLSELAIFVDILPGYRITLIGDHHPSGDKDGERTRQLLSKEVRELRTFERNLLAAYETFLSVVKRYATQDTQRGRAKMPKQLRTEQQRKKALPFLLTSSNGSDMSPQDFQAADKIRLVCVQCLLKMLLSRPTFNHADELMTIAVALADGTHAGSRALAADAIIKIFIGEDFDDPESQVAAKMVRLVGQRIKKRGDRARPELFYCLNRLKLKVDMTEVRQEGRNKKRRNRKRRYKHADEVERELAEADAKIKDKQRKEAHADMLREVIVVYFRVLKEERISRHLPIILRGLSKLAHLINIDIVADLVRELRRISQQCAVAAGHTHHGGISGLGRGGKGSGASGMGANQPAATATTTALAGSHLTLSADDELLLLLSVFTTLEGPGEELKVDCTFFLERLHQLVLDLPTLCLAADARRLKFAEAKKLRLSGGPGAADGDGSILHLMDQESVMANVHGAKRWRGSHPVILVAQCLDMAYLRRHESNPQRSAIVCRRLLQVAAQLKAHEALSMITAARFIMQKYPKVAQLMADPPEDGVFAAPGFPDDSGIQARPTAWHLVPLQRHFHPQVRLAASEIVRGKPAAPRDTAVVLFDRHDSSDGGFNPAPAANPPPGVKGYRPRSLEFARAGVTGFEDILEELGAGVEGEGSASASAR